MSMKNKKVEEKSPVLSEDAVAYQTPICAKGRSVPSVVIEDYKIGIEQYERKEYVSAESVLKRIRRGV